MKQTPSIGRIVHYRRPGSADGKHKAETSPAIITEVYSNDDCQLTIFNPNGMYMARIPYAGDGHIKPSHWHWPSFTPAPAPPTPMSEVKPWHLPNAVYERIARVCHQANKAFSEYIGDSSQVDWEFASTNIQNSAINGVKFIFDNPKASDSALHDNWMKFKIETGWKYGEVKDTEKKTHPCLLPFEKLLLYQQQKDRLFKAIVTSFID